MQLVWEERHYIKSFDVDFNKRVRLDSIFRFLQETASHHAEHLNFGFDSLREQKLGWVLARMKIKMNRYPLWKEEVIVKTWPNGADRLFALRDYEIYDTDNNKIGEVSSSWLLIDLKSLKAVRSGPFLEREKIKNDRPPLLGQLRKIRIKHEFTDSYEKYIRYCDIDQNDHVNNTKYIEWFLNGLSREMYTHYIIKSLQVDFIAEAKFGDKALVKKTDMIDGKIFISADDMAGDTTFSTAVIELTPC